LLGVHETERRQTNEILVAVRTNGRVGSESNRVNLRDIDAGVESLERGLLLCISDVDADRTGTVLSQSWGGSVVLPHHSGILATMESS